jgi:hypothetical protein
MDIGLFALGTLGALVIVYIAKQQIIPEFRALFDTTEAETEVNKHLGHIDKIQQEIDSIQETMLNEESMSDDHLQRLTVVLNTAQPELQAETKRLEVLQRQITQSQIFSRGLGFIVYIVLGGVFGALLAGHVHVDGLGAGLPMYFESMLIGATWTTYLSTIGFKVGQQKAQQNADDKLQTLNQESTKKLEELKNMLVPQVETKVAKAERADPVDQPTLAPELAQTVNNALDQASKEMQRQTDQTRQMIRKDFQRI